MRDTGLEGRTALVLGASKGLGKACAGALAASGANVVLCARTAADLETTANQLRGETRTIEALALDVGDRGATEPLLSSIRDGRRAIDVFVWNVGVSPIGNFDAFDEDDFRAAIETHFLAAVRFYKAVLPGMRERKWGRIVNISIGQARQPAPTNILAASTRLGLIGLAKALSRDVIRDGVTINSVIPGQMATEGLFNALRQRAEREGGTMEAKVAAMLRDLPAGRHGRPEELGATVAFLCSEAAGYITGTTLAVDGGDLRAVL